MHFGLLSLFAYFAVASAFSPALSFRHAPVAGSRSAVAVSMVAPDEDAQASEVMPASAGEAGKKVDVSKAADAAEELMVEPAPKFEMPQIDIDADSVEKATVKAVTKTLEVTKEAAIGAKAFYEENEIGAKAKDAFEKAKKFDEEHDVLLTLRAMLEIAITKATPLVKQGVEAIQANLNGKEKLAVEEPPPPPPAKEKLFGMDLPTIEMPTMKKVNPKKKAKKQPKKKGGGLDLPFF